MPPSGRCRRTHRNADRSESAHDRCYAGRTATTVMRRLFDDQRPFRPCLEVPGKGADDSALSCDLRALHFRGDLADDTGQIEWLPDDQDVVRRRRDRLALSGHDQDPAVGGDHTQLTE